VISRPHALAVEDASLGDERQQLQKTSSRGETVAAQCLARDCLVILGWTAEEIAAEGLASLSAGGDQGRFRALAWISENGRERWFVAAVRAPEIGGLKPGEPLLLRGAGATVPLVIEVPQLANDGAQFAAALKSRAGSKLGPAVRFLLESFSTRASRQMTAVSAFLAAVLEGTSQDLGMVELFGAIEGEGLLLQGWLRHSLAGRQHFLLMSDVLDEHEAICANYTRGDLSGRGVGMLTLLRPKTAIRLDELHRLYLRVGDLFYRVGVLPNAMRLRDDEASNHLRAMLPTLLLNDELQQTLRAAVRPRFAGLDTVSGLVQPVRMAIDLAAHIPGVGWYITGWMLDPANLVAQAMLKDRDGMAERIDLGWTRIRRDDVNAGYRDDPRFAAALEHNQHGFTIFAPHHAASPQAWLELQLKDEHVAFMPLNVVSGEGAEGRKRLLESVDLHKPSASEIIERHLGPLFHAAKSLPRRHIGHQVLRPLAAWRNKPDAALLIPIVDAAVRTKIVVAQLASRNPGRGIAPFFICSSDLREYSSALLRELAFYRLDAAVILADSAVDLGEALDLGVRASEAARFIFMSPSTHALRDNWAADLIAAVPPDEAAVVTPTLLYEDWSIGYAGIDDIRFFDAAPFADPVHAHAGYPRDAVCATRATATLAGSLDCCAMTRTTYDKLDGFSAGYALARTSGLDLFLRLRKDGVRMLWLPQVEAYTLGEDGTPSDYGTRTGELVDGWSLRASWKDRLPKMIDVAREEKPVPLADVVPDELVLPISGGLIDVGADEGASGMGIR